LSEFVFHYQQFSSSQAALTLVNEQKVENELEFDRLAVCAIYVCVNTFRRYYRASAV